MRSVTAVASCGETGSTCGKVSGAADPHADLVRADAPALADRLGADHRRPARPARRSPARAGRRRAWGGRARPGACACPRGRSARSRRARGSPARSRACRRRPAPRLTGNAPSEFRNQATSGLREQLLLGDVVDRPPRADADDERVQERAVVGRRRSPGPLRDVLAPDARQPEVEVEERLEHRPRRASRRSGSRPRSRARAWHAGDAPWPLAIRSLQRRTQPGAARYSAARWPSTAHARCAARSPGASPPRWLAQQPLDKRVFGSRLRRRRAARPRSSRAAARPAVGALPARRRTARCSAPLYANVAPQPAGRRAAARAARRRWPSTSGRGRRSALVDAARSLRRRGRAFAQAAWRHLLFGLVLGELERRLNPPAAELEPVERRGRRLQRPRLGGAPGRGTR